MTFCAVVSSKIIPPFFGAVRTHETALFPNQVKSEPSIKLVEFSLREIGALGFPLTLLRAGRKPPRRFFSTATTAEPFERGSDGGEMRKRKKKKGFCYVHPLVRNDDGVS